MIGSGPKSHFADSRMPSEFETKVCNVTGCGRTATTSRADAPMCDRCAEEWETVGPMMAAASDRPSNTLTPPVRRFLMRIIFGVARLARWITSSIGPRHTRKPKQKSDTSDQPGPPASGAAA